MSLQEPLGIYDLTPFTMLDFPGELACIVWLSGCNLRCRYCHNPAMIPMSSPKPWAEAYTLLQQRRSRLSGVVFSGGEATVHPNLPYFAQQAKQLGYKVKLDTNGTRPEVVKQLLDANLIDMIALDYKAPPGKFHAVTHANPRLWDKFSTTLDMLIQQSTSPSPVAFEVRTTVHTNLLNEDDISWIQSDLSQRGYTGAYYVQNYRHGVTEGNLPEQTAPLATTALPTGGKVHVAFRNF